MLVGADGGIDVGAAHSAPNGRPRARAPPDCRMAISGLAPPATVTRSARWTRRACTRDPLPHGSRVRSPTAQALFHGERRRRPCHVGRLRHQPGAESVRVGDGGREADGLEAGGEDAQAGEAERQEVAALVGDQRMQFVEDDGVEIGEEAVGVGRRQEQRRLLRRGEQDVRRVQLLALALVERRVAGARLQPHGKADLGDRLFQVAGDIDGERLQRRDVERVDAAAGRRVRRRPLVERDQARQEAGERLAGAGRRDQQGRAAGSGLFEQLDLVRSRRPAARGEPGGERARAEGPPGRRSSARAVTRSEVTPARHSVHH